MVGRGNGEGGAERFRVLAETGRLKDGTSGVRRKLLCDAVAREEDRKLEREDRKSRRNRTGRSGSWNAGIGSPGKTGRKGPEVRANGAEVLAKPWEKSTGCEGRRTGSPWKKKITEKYRK